MVRKLSLLVGAALVAAVAAVGASAASTPQDVHVYQDAGTKPRSVTMGGADVLPTTRTVQHWYSTAVDPHNGVTYGFNMVGANPYTCGNGSACDATVPVDIVPLTVNIGGSTFSSGSNVLDATLASPQFAPTDFTSTPHSTVIVPDEFLADGTLNPAYNPNAPGFGSGGLLSPGNTNVQLQDATMRSQFNRAGAGDSYHLRLAPTVHPAITIDVPRQQGVIAASVRGVRNARIDVGWWSSKLNNLMKSLSYVDPTHLVLFLTDDVVLYDGNDPANCCIIGYHGAGKVTGNGAGSTHSNGNAVVQTFAWGSYVSPGIFNPQYDWALQDIHAISHEIAEWGDDPFTNNWVEPWLTPTAPQYGCTNILETGDPVVGIGFSSGSNTFRQLPGGTISWTDAAGIHHTIATTDGTYHPEDEALLPWFLRFPSNATGSQPTQPPLTGGRYTFMGSLNPYPGFRAPATGC